MTPPPRPGIPLQVFWHFPARKDRARFCRHAKNFFRLPLPFQHDRQNRERIRFLRSAFTPGTPRTAAPLHDPDNGPRHPTPHRRPYRRNFTPIPHGIRLHASRSRTPRHRPASLKADFVPLTSGPADTAARNSRLFSSRQACGRNFCPSNP